MDALVTSLSQVSISATISAPPLPLLPGVETLLPQADAATPSVAAAAATAAPPPLAGRPLRPYQSRIIQCLQRLYLRRQAATRPLFCPRPPVIIRPAGISPSTAPFPPTPAGCSAALGGEEGLALGAGGGSSPGAALLYLPTGGGKTRIAGELAKWVLRAGGCVLFVVNRTVLVSQAAAALRELGLGAEEVCVWGGGEAAGSGYLQGRVLL